MLAQNFASIICKILFLLVDDQENRNGKRLLLLMSKRKENKTKSVWVSV